MTSAFDLTGRAALVTGAGSPTGIGFATAQLLSEMGAAVIITSTTDRIHDRVSELRANGAEALGMVGDLTDPRLLPTWWSPPSSSGGGSTWSFKTRA